MVIFGGDGVNPSHINGGNGGSIDLRGGNARGENYKDDGGDIDIRGGFSKAGFGGFITAKTGFSFGTSSGSASITTANAGVKGVSGSMRLATGTSSFGNTGSLMILTGVGRFGKGGNITIGVGTGDSGEGSPLNLRAGATVSESGVGGGVSVMSGQSEAKSSGNLEISTPNAGSAGVSGAIWMSTGMRSLYSMMLDNPIPITCNLGVNRHELARKYGCNCS